MLLGHKKVLGCLRSASRLACLKTSYASIFTLTRTPLTHRRPDLGVVGDFETAHFERLLGNKRESSMSVLTRPDDVEPYIVDYTGQFRGSSRLVLRPNSTEQVADTMKLCNNWKLGVVPQGGNTSLVGTSTPIFDEVVISTRGMNKILSIDRDTCTVICEAGVIPADLEKVLADTEYDLVPPLDLGSWDTSCIGGNAATNARGIRSLHYPDFRSSILGLEAVLANGEVLNVLEGSRKDLVGVDLKQCLIGTEGTFGIITKVAMRCPPRPKSNELAILTCKDFDSLKKLLQLARMELAETLAAFEYMNHAAIAITSKQLNLQLPDGVDSYGGGKHHTVLVESSSYADDTRAHVLMSGFIEKARSKNICVSGTISQSLDQKEKLWAFRKSIIDACKAVGPVFKFDLNISMSQLPELVRLVESVRAGDWLLRPGGKRSDCSYGSEPSIRDLILFGQISCGCIHVVATVDPESYEIPPDVSPDVKLNYVPACVTRLESILCNWLKMGSGPNNFYSGFLSIAKDHAGKQVRWVHRLDVDEYGTKGSPGRELQLALKRAWDPRSLMNPYKTWPFLSF